MRGPEQQRLHRRLVRPIPGSENQLAGEPQGPPASGDGHEGSFGSPARLPCVRSATGAPRKVRSLARRHSISIRNSPSLSCRGPASDVPRLRRCLPATWMKLSSMNHDGYSPSGENGGLFVLDRFPLCVMIPGDQSLDGGCPLPRSYDPGLLRFDRLGFLAGELRLRRELSPR